MSKRAGDWARVVPTAAIGRSGASSAGQFASKRVEAAPSSKLADRPRPERQQRQPFRRPRRLLRAVHLAGVEFALNGGQSRD
jgi:hypothetical protein